MRQYKYIKRILIIACLLVSSYTVIGALRILNFTPLILSYYYINPELIARSSNLYVPFGSYIAKWKLSKLDRNDLINFFERNKLTPYHILIMYRGRCSQMSDALKKEKLRISVELTDLLVEMGVSLDMTDKNGCSSLHSALIANENEIVQYLIEKSSHRTSKGMPDAILEPCRIDAIVLLEENGAQ